MTPLNKLIGLNDVFGVWYFKPHLRVTFVSSDWLIVWDHRNKPPQRYDCRGENHTATCLMAADKLQELTTSK